MKKFWRLECSFIFCNTLAETNIFRSDIKLTISCSINLFSASTLNNLTHKMTLAIGLPVLAVGITKPPKKINVQLKCFSEKMLRQWRISSWIYTQRLNTNLLIYSHRPCSNMQKYYIVRWKSLHFHNWKSLHFQNAIKAKGKFGVCLFIFWKISKANIIAYPLSPQAYSGNQDSSTAVFFSVKILP